LLRSSRKGKRLHKIAQLPLPVINTLGIKGYSPFGICT